MQIEREIYLDYPVHVKIDVDLETIIGDMFKDPDTVHRALYLINECANMINGIPDKVVDEILESQKKIIVKYFEKVIDKFK